MREFKTQLARMSVVIEGLFFSGEVNQSVRIGFGWKQEPTDHVRQRIQKATGFTHSDHSGCIDSDCRAEAAPVSREYIHLRSSAIRIRKERLGALQEGLLLV